MIKLTSIIEQSEFNVNVKEGSVSGFFWNIFSVWYYIRDGIRHGITGKYKK